MQISWIVVSPVKLLRKKLNKIVPKNHRKSVKLMSRDIQLAVLAADDAMRDCGLDTRANNPDGPISIDPARSRC